MNSVCISVGFAVLARMTGLTTFCQARSWWLGSWRVCGMFFFVVAAMAEYFLGVDLGGTNIVVGLLDDQGIVLARRSEPTQVELGPDSAIERIGQSCEALLAQCQVPLGQLGAVGVGSPGPLSVRQGVIINPGNLPGFSNLPIRALLSARLKAPVVLENDANSACWGEFWMGAGKDVTDMVMFTLGTGIGGGIVCNGELVHGSGDNGAELGHMIIEPGGRLCTCGQRGCLEAYASATATAARPARRLSTAGSLHWQKYSKRKAASVARMCSSTLGPGTSWLRGWSPALLRR